MPNFIHSLDAANVHLLLYSLCKLNIPAYTVHDCFAATPNNMLTIEKLVKEAFINIYFKDEGYLLKLHKLFVDAIISVTDPYSDDGGDIYSEYNNQYENLKTLNDKTIKVINRNSDEIIEIPNLPIGYFEKNLNEFIKGLLNSKYFIG